MVVCFKVNVCLWIFGNKQLLPVDVIWKAKEKFAGKLSAIFIHYTMNGESIWNISFVVEGVTCVVLMMPAAVNLY